MWRRRRREQGELTATQIAAAQELARETMRDDHLAVERYAGQAVPRDAASALAEGEAGDG